MTVPTYPHVRAAIQHLIWALEEIEKAGNQRAARHARKALGALRHLHTDQLEKNSDAARQCTLNPPRRMPASLNASIRAALVPVTHITVVDFGIGYPRACVGKHIAGAATVTVH